MLGILFSTPCHLEILIKYAIGERESKDMLEILIKRESIAH